MNYPFATIFFCFTSCFGAAVYHVKDVPIKEIHVPVGYDEVKALIADYQSVVKNHAHLACASQKMRHLIEPKATDYLIKHLALIKKTDEYFREMKIRLLQDDEFKEIYDEDERIRKHHKAFFDGVNQLIIDDEAVAIKLFIFCRHYQVLRDCSLLHIYSVLDDAFGGDVLGNSKHVIVDVSSKGLPILKDSRCLTLKVCDLYDRENVSNLLDDMLWLREERYKKS